MKTKTLKFGIASPETYQARIFAMLNGKFKPTTNEPKIWFASIETLAKNLSSESQKVFEIIATAKPSSISELIALTGFEKKFILCTLRIMKQYGLVKVKRNENNELMPIALYDNFKVECDFIYPENFACSI